MWPNLRTRPSNAATRSGPWRILYPPPESALTRTQDDNTLVLQGTFDGTRILLLSDLSHAGQNALLNLDEDLRADIVVAGLPGDGEPLSDALLNAVQPKAIVAFLLIRKCPQTKKAGFKLKQRLEHRGVAIFYTSANDAVTLTVRGDH